MQAPEDLQTSLSSTNDLLSRVRAFIELAGAQKSQPLDESTINGNYEWLSGEGDEHPDTVEMELSLGVFDVNTHTHGDGDGEHTRGEGDGQHTHGDMGYGDTSYGGDMPTIYMDEEEMPTGPSICSIERISGDPRPLIQEMEDESSGEEAETGDEETGDEETGDEETEMSETETGDEDMETRQEE